MCCRIVQQQQQHESQLMLELNQRIKARYVQLGGYLHDADEHKKEAKRLMREGRDLGARAELKLSLEKQALHAQEEAKYKNLVGLRKVLLDAKQNLSMAELLQRCSHEVQSTLEKMPDIAELRGGPVAVELELPSVPSVTDQQVSEALERLRKTPAAAAVKDSTRVPLLLSE